MAFYYFTTETIKEIDPQAVPDSFREYYADLSDEMKRILQVRQHLVPLRDHAPFKVLCDDDRRIARQTKDH